MTEYWYARRFPVGHWRNAMAPISPKAHRVTWVLVSGFTLGMVAFFVFGLAGEWRIGAAIFAVLAGGASWYFFFEPIKRFDRFHTVEDYKAGRVPSHAHMAEKVDGRFTLTKAFAGVSEHWRPQAIASLNGQEVKVVKVKGEFPWHYHEEADEMFLVWRGEIRLEFRDRVVPLRAGEGMVVPRGVEHRPVAAAEAEILLFEPAGTRNTGNVVDAQFTAPDPAASLTPTNPDSAPGDRRV